VLAYNDGLALQLYHEAGRRGLKVPEDLALVGVDNYCWDYHGVELTSVDLNLREVGRQAAILFTRIADENLVFEPGRPVGVEVEPTLAVRTSSIGR